MNLEYKHNTLVGLLKDVKIKICAFLTPHEIINFCLGNKTQAKLLSERALYQILFDYYCPDAYVVYPNSQEDNYETKWKYALDSYKKVVGLVYALLAKCGENNLQEKHIWSSVVSQDRKYSLEKGLKVHGIKLPIDCYILYRIANSTKEFEKSKKKNISNDFMFNNIFGSFAYYDRQLIWNLDSIPNQLQKNGNFIFYPMFTALRTQFKLFIDINNQFGKGIGTIYSLTARRDDVANNKVWIKAFIYKKSITALLEECNRHPYDEARGFIDLCDTLDNAKGDVTTQGIRVRANCFYSAWDKSYQDNELFSYQIRYSNNGVKGKYKLTTRHWIINDRGENRNVDGPGVIGFHPEIYSGCDDFYYESCSPMYDFTGTIKGKFKFKNMENPADEIEVLAPEMKFEFPKGSALLEFVMNGNEVKTIVDRLNE